MVLNLLAPLPSRMASLTLQSRRLLIDRHHRSPRPLLIHPLTPRPLLPLPLPFRSSILQNSSKAPPLNPFRTLPMRWPPLHHGPLPYLHNTTRVSLTRLLFTLVLCAKVKMAILPHLLGLLCTRVPWQMAKTVVLVSVVGRKLVLAVLALVPRLRLCLVQD
jgi:hypothetical protein